jgi:type IV pilus assembly protein PilF
MAAGLLLAGCVTVKPPSPIPPPDDKEAARINTQLGIAYLQQGQPRVAKEKLDRAVQQNPNYAPAHEGLAMFYAGRGDNDAAEDEYRRALRLDSRSSSLKNNFGVFLCQHGKVKEAADYLRSAAEDINYATPEAAWTNLGLCLLQHGGDKAEAEKDFRQAVRINPNFGSALLQLAGLSIQQQDYLDARAFLQRYERSGPATPDSLAMRAQVERKLGDSGAAHDYQMELLRKFPDSPQAQALSKDAGP